MAPTNRWWHDVAMTSYCYTLDLDDAEAAVVEEALKMLSQQCANEIANGSGVPFHAWTHSIDQVLKQISNTRAAICGPYPVTGPPVDEQLEIWKSKTQHT